MIIFNILFICNCTLYSYILALKLCDILNFRPKPIMPHTYKQKTDRASTPLLDISLKAVTTAKENGVVMLTLPPHTSHRSQPLDKTVYGPLKTYTFRAMDGLDAHTSWSNRIELRGRRTCEASIYVCNDPHKHHIRFQIYRHIHIDT